MSLKAFVNTPAMYQDFVAMLENKIKQVQSRLEQTTDLHEVYRLQGQIFMLRRLLNLRDEVNTVDKSYG